MAALNVCRRSAPLGIGVLEAAPSWEVYDWAVDHGCPDSDEVLQNAEKRLGQ